MFESLPHIHIELTNFSCAPNFKWKKVKWIYGKKKSTKEPNVLKKSTLFSFKQRILVGSKQQAIACARCSNNKWFKMRIMSLVQKWNDTKYIQYIWYCVGKSIRYYCYIACERTSARSFKKWMPLKNREGQHCWIYTKYNMTCITSMISAVAYICTIVVHT